MGSRTGQDRRDLITQQVTILVTRFGSEIKAKISTWWWMSAVNNLISVSYQTVAVHGKLIGCRKFKK